MLPRTPAGLLLPLPALLLLLCGLGGGTAKKMNVLYFVCDDLRPEFLAAYDQKVMITPTLDKLANEALVFDKAYCSVAVCSPSRNSFMSGRRPHRTLVFDNGGTDFRANGQGANWTTLPQHFLNSGWLTLGGGKTFHPGHPANWDEPQSWSQDQPYYKFSYALGHCPGKCGSDGHSACKPGDNPTGGQCSGIDTWCPMEGPDEQFYDFGLANNTIERLQYAALPNNTARPFFIQSGFARPHAPWRVPQRFWDMYEHVDMPLAKHRTTIEMMAGVAWHQQGFYSAENGTVWVPMLDQPIPGAVQRGVRRAYNLDPEHNYLGRNSELAEIYLLVRFEIGSA
jgi:iduronate 2-sulfatase